MEDILTRFNADNLEIKLTSEKLFINTATSNETFALRSVNGIGVVDLVDDYNTKLTEWKKKSTIPYLLFICGGLCFLSLFGRNTSGSDLGPILAMGAVFIGIGYFLLNKRNKEKPNLMSAVRIMMSGGNRDFEFDKTGFNSGNIAEFVAKVESTLTAYHKNNE